MTITQIVEACQLRDGTLKPRPYASEKLQASCKGNFASLTASRKFGCSTQVRVSLAAIALLLIVDHILANYVPHYFELMQSRSLPFYFASIHDKLRNTRSRSGLRCPRMSRGPDDINRNLATRARQ